MSEQELRGRHPCIANKDIDIYLDNMPLEGKSFLVDGVIERKAMRETTVIDIRE